MLGDPTETALLVAAQRIGLDVAALRRDHPRIGELPFDSDRKLMTTLHPAPGAASALGVVAGDGPLAVVKGAPDRMLALARSVLHDGRIVPVDGEWSERLRRANDDLARGGMRVLAVGCRTLASADDLADAEGELVMATT